MPNAVPHDDDLEACPLFCAFFLSTFCTHSRGGCVADTHSMNQPRTLTLGRPGQADTADGNRSSTLSDRRFVPPSRFHRHRSLSSTFCGFQAACSTESGTAGHKVHLATYRCFQTADEMREAFAYKAPLGIISRPTAGTMQRRPRGIHTLSIISIAKGGFVSETSWDLHAHSRSGNRGECVFLTDKHPRYQIFHGS